jgi:hypothetical protein
MGILMEQYRIAPPVVQRTAETLFFVQMEAARKLCTLSES